MFSVKDLMENWWYFNSSDTVYLEKYTWISQLFLWLLISIIEIVNKGKLQEIEIMF